MAIPFTLQEIAAALSCLAMTPLFFVIASPDRLGRGNPGAKAIVEINQLVRSLGEESSWEIVEPVPKRERGIRLLAITVLKNG